MDLTFGKSLNLREESLKYLYSYSSRAKDFISANGQVSAPLKDAQQNSKKKPVITLIFEPKGQVIYIKFDLEGDILIYNFRLFKLPWEFMFRSGNPHQ